MYNYLILSKKYCIALTGIKIGGSQEETEKRSKSPAADSRLRCANVPCIEYRLEPTDLAMLCQETGITDPCKEMISQCKEEINLMHHGKLGLLPHHGKFQEQTIYSLPEDLIVEIAAQLVAHSSQPFKDLSILKSTYVNILPINFVLFYFIVLFLNNSSRHLGLV